MSAWVCVGLWLNMELRMKSEVRIGIIGVGYWGPNLVRNYSEIDECELLWVCDLSRDRLDYISERFPGVKVTKDYR